MPIPSQSPPGELQTVSELQRKVNELHGMVRSLTGSTEQGLFAASREVGHAVMSDDPTAHVSATSQDDIAVSADPRSEMMVRSGSEAELLKLYRERRMTLASERGSSCKGARSSRAGSHRAPISPRVVPPPDRRASTGTLGTSSLHFDTPRRASPESRGARPPAVGAQMRDEQHRIFTSGLRGGRDLVAEQRRPAPHSGGGATRGGPDSARSSACSTPAQACRRRHGDPSPSGGPAPRARAATPRAGPETTPRKSTPRRTPSAGKASAVAATTHPLLAFAAEVQGLNANASSDALSTAELQSESPTTPPLSARVASSRFGTPPASSQPPTSSDEVQRTVIVPPCADPAATKNCQTTPAGCASSSGASTRASTPRVSGSTPGNDSAWDSRVDDFSAGPSAAPTPTAPSYTIKSPLVSDNHACRRGQTPTPLRYSPAAQRATSLGNVSSADACAAGRRSAQASSEGPPPRGLIGDCSHAGKSVPLPWQAFGPPTFVLAPGSRPTVHTSSVTGGRTLRSGSSSAVRRYPVGLCQPYIATSSRTLSPARIEQMRPQVHCQMNL